MAYTGLFVSIRSGDWSLRMASAKKMAPLFTAFDHLMYQKLISQHIADVITLPLVDLTMFQQGAFVVSITGRPWHSVGIDEAHEMLINKQCKMSIVGPSKDYINRIAHYIPYRTRCLQNVKAQLFTERTDDLKCPDNPFSSHHTDQNSEHNIRVQMKLMDDKSLISMQTSNIRLVDPFTSKKATPEH